MGKSMFASLRFNFSLNSCLCVLLGVEEHLGPLEEGLKLFADVAEDVPLRAAGLSFGAAGAAVPILVGIEEGGVEPFFPVGVAGIDGGDMLDSLAGTLEGEGGLAQGVDMG